jgi:hypothetical protein
MKQRQQHTKDFPVVTSGHFVDLILFVCGVDKGNEPRSSTFSKPAKPLLRMLNSGGSFFVRRARP